MADIRNRIFIFFFLFSGACVVLPLSGQDPDKTENRLGRKAVKRSALISGLFREWQHTGVVVTDSIQVDATKRILSVYLSPAATQIPVRSAWVDHLKTEISKGLGRRFKNYTVQLISRGRRLEEYIPNYYREQASLFDTNRIIKSYRGIPLVTRCDQPVFPGGLERKHIALWPSHGYFFDQQLDRWQWQRARLWETVEDIFPWSFTASYLVPMLENAGATVLLPRERDTQINEVIVDNDRIPGNSELYINNGASVWQKAEHPGFIYVDTLYPGQNPFMMGTFLSLEVTPGDSSSLTYVPDIPETGEYAVYGSWGKSDQCIERVSYEVRYTGDTARFLVNQCLGAGTWIYLGTFQFNKGISIAAGSVVITCDAKGILTADAVRFGGGMGNVVRRPGLSAEVRKKSVNDGLPASEILISEDADIYNEKLSGMPRWMEGSRYYLQYSGMPDTIVYSLNSGKNDYNDDYMSRGEWVNYLIGTQKPQFSKKYNSGPGIPLDLALAFHTDAGITENDSVIGTLGIYSTSRNNGVFPNGKSRLASRDLSDLIQTQVVEDIRQLVNPSWTRRALWDKEYSEAWRPIIPVMLLELLSHQNLADMKYGLDPRFKFIAARAVYKGMLRYLCVQDGKKAIVQPLPPDHLAIEVQMDRTIKLSWRPVTDPIENTAVPGGYRVYMRKENQGFDTGKPVQDTCMLITLPEWGQIYSFRVTAFNDGGESLPGETLSVSLFSDDRKPVLIVNAFDRICGPAFFDKGDMAGIAWWEDEGVARCKDYSHSGNQYDFNRNSDWLNDDSQGWGASHADYETKPIAGNTFDFSLVHGKALRDAGYSFVSVSDEVFESAGFDPNSYPAIDLIFGEERGTESLNGSSGMDFRVFTPGMRESVSKYTSQGGNVFISGAYIGTDMVENADSLAIHFAEDILHFTWRTHHAAATGSVKVTDQATGHFPQHLLFNTDYHSEIYRVESPDAIEPAGEGSFRIYRYASGNRSAGVAYNGTYRTVALGFPFETLIHEEQRTELMSGIMKFFASPQKIIHK